MSDEWERFQRAEAARSAAASEAHRGATTNLGTAAFRGGFRPGFMGGIAPPIPAPGAATDAADPEIVKELRARLIAQRRGMAVPPPEGAELEWGELAPKPRPDTQSDVEADLEALRMLGAEDAGIEAERIAPPAAEVDLSGANGLPDASAPDQAAPDAPQANVGVPAYPSLEDLAKSAALKSGLPVARKCPECGETFAVTSRNAKQECCSRRCAMRRRIAAQLGKQAVETRYSVWAHFMDGRKAQLGLDLTAEEAEETKAKAQKYGFSDHAKREYGPSEFEVQVREQE